MPKGTNQKMKLIRLMEIMLKYTDEDHALSIGQICEKLSEWDITADRKSLYDDFEALRIIGIDITGEKSGRSYVYRVASRDFELAELKLLVDAIHASRFITARKSSELIKKIGKLCSVYDATQLSRQVEVIDRIKTMNESIYYNVDAIHNAINNNREISFYYYQWNMKKELEVRNGGKAYVVSPFALTWDSENYYLVAYDDNKGQIRHYRVDKMRSISMGEESRKGRDVFEASNPGGYLSRSFGMFGGREESVTLRFKNHFMGVVMDRFGRDVMIFPDGEECFKVTVKVNVSDQFYGWIFGLGEGVSIVSPGEVAEGYRQRAARAAGESLTIQSPHSP